MGGGVADSISAQMELDGVELPKEIREQPRIRSDLLVYLDAFYELDSERSHGTSLVRIPWSCIVRYGDRYGFDVEELVYFIRKMDDAHLASLRKKDDGGSTGTRTVVPRPPRPD